MHDRHEPVTARHLEVRVDPEVPFDRVVRKFTRRVRNDGVLREVFLRRGYVKPSEERRLRRLRARAQARRSVD